MPNKMKVIIDVNNDLFPSDASPMPLVGYSKMVLSDINNEDNLDILINFAQVSSDVPQVPAGVATEKVIDIPQGAVGVLFIGVDISEGKSASFDIEFF